MLAARIKRNLRQKDVAGELTVSGFTLGHWEKGLTAPPVKYYPAILKFLGYDPRPTPESLGERLIHARETMGLSRRQLAARLDVDEGSLAHWEREDNHPSRRCLLKLQDFLGSD